MDIAGTKKMVTLYVVELYVSHMLQTFINPMWKFLIFIMVIPIGVATYTGSHLVPNRRLYFI